MSGIGQSISDANMQSDSALAVVAISLSAGGLRPLRAFVRGLATDIPAAIIVAQHVCDHTHLPEILATDTCLPVVLAPASTPLIAGTIYVCPTQQHVIVNPDATLSLSRRRRVTFFRPSGDWLFESVAASFRERALAIVLSGVQNDGARGVRAVHGAGGTVIVQRPQTCEHADMPTASIDTGCVDFVLDPDRIPVVVSSVLGRIDFSRCRGEWIAPFSGVVDGHRLPAN